MTCFDYWLLSLYRRVQIGIVMVAYIYYKHNIS